MEQGRHGRQRRCPSPQAEGSSRGGGYPLDLLPMVGGHCLAYPRFWLLTGALGLAVFTHQMLFVHQAAYLVDGGYDKMLAASVVGLRR